MTELHRLVREYRAILETLDDLPPKKLGKAAKRLFRVGDRIRKLRPGADLLKLWPPTELPLFPPKGDSHESPGRPEHPPDV